MASNASRPVPLSTRSAAAPVLRFERCPQPLAVSSAPDAELRDPIEGDGRRRALQDTRQLRAERDRAKRCRVAGPPRLKIAVEPAVPGALDAGRGRLHVILGVEVGAGRVGRTTRMNDRQVAAIPKWLERAETRVEAEEAVEIERASLSGVGAGNRDARAGAIVLGLAARDDHTKAIYRATLKDSDEPPRPARVAGGEGRPPQKRGSKPEADQREGAVLQKDSPGDHGFLLLAARKGVRPLFVFSRAT